MNISEKNVNKSLISVRDHEHFQDRQLFMTRFTAGKSETDRLYNQNMFVIPPEDWKYIRRLFTPVFTSTKLKVMVRSLTLSMKQYSELLLICDCLISQSYLMHNCTADFISDLGQHANSDTAFDAIVLTKKFALDIIASCAYGIEVQRVQSKLN